MKKRSSLFCRECGKKLCSFNKSGECFSHATSRMMRADRLSDEDIRKRKRRLGIIEDPFEALFEFLNSETEVGDGK